MGRLRWKYDAANGPFLFTTDASATPNNTTPTAICLNLGTSTYPVLSTVSGSVLDVRSSFSHTSGDARSIYNRLTLTGSVGGEALRCFTNVNANLDTARGAHISLNFAATAGGSECSGLGTALTCTLHIPNIASWAPTGTYAAAHAEIYSDGSSSDPAGMTELSFLRISNSGDGTGKADVDTDGFLMSIQGFTAAANVTKILSSVSLGELPANSVGLRVKIGAGTYYIPAVLSTEWN